MSPASTAAALSLSRRVVRVLASSATVEDAASGVLREVAALFGWSVGFLWLVDDRTGLLRWGADWAADDGAEDMRRVLRRLTFTPGVGVPGEVFESLTARWVADLDRGRLQQDAADLPRSDAILAAGLRAVIDVPVVSGDGPVGVMEFFAAAPQPESRERIDAISVVGQQLAEYLTRVRVEQRLRATEESSASIVEAALDCIVTMDHRGRVIDFNPAAESVFGYPCDDVIGELLADLIIPPQLRDAHHRALRSYVETGEPSILNQRLELEGMRADGSTFPVELTVTRLGSGDPPVFAGFIRDITARREADEQRASLLALEREARLRAEEAERAARTAAETLQRTLLPPHLPAVPRLELGAAYRAGSEGWQVGGDFYDVFELEQDRWALVVGDVCGKGVEAAAQTAMLRYATRAAAVRHAAPRDVVAALNDAMQRDTGGGAFCTAIYATFGVARDHPAVCLASAGHPLPLLLDEAGAVRSLGSPGTLLGAFPEVEVHQHELELRPGEMLVLYTDGVTEARTADGLFGPDRLAALIADCRGCSAAEVAQRVESAVVAATRGGEVSDDLAIVAVRAVG